MSDEQITLSEIDTGRDGSEEDEESAADGSGVPYTDFAPATVEAVGDGEIAAETPVIEAGTPSHVLSFIVRADWGHFRRIDRTVTKQTYRVIPKTTLAGLCAAIVGAPRDSYYDVFSPEHSAVAIAPVRELRTMTMSSLGVWTNMDARQQKAGASPQSHSTTVQWPNTVTDRQRHPYEYLVSPAYRIDLAVEEEAFYREFAARLASGTAHYTPSLGLSELLASIEFLGEHRVEPIDSTGEAIEVHSVVPDGINHAVPPKDVSYHVERTPHAMQADDGGRTTTSFADYTYTASTPDQSDQPDVWTGSIDGQLTTPITIGTPDHAQQYGRINGRTVAFL